MDEREDATAGNREAWELAARKYEDEVESDADFLRAGGVSLLPVERAMLGDLTGCRRAVHLQCSHGLDTLSLLHLGAAEVVGVDFSAAMLGLARRKAERLGAAAAWVRADVLALPGSLRGTADLVYTGKGALPWVQDLARWAEGVAGLLAPGGSLFLLEGHPLNWVWRPGASRHELDRSREGYFDAASRANESFPASALRRFAPAGAPPPEARERQWTLGRVVTALAEAGLAIERLSELSEHYWPQFPDMPPSEEALLPHSYALRARRPG